MHNINRLLYYMNVLIILNYESALHFYINLYVCES